MPRMTLQDLESGEEINIPAVWEICETCGGDGTSSAYLGAFTSDDIVELGEEWREDYFAGRFDRPCDECKGSGKVLFPNLGVLNDREKAAWDEECSYRSELEKERSMRERGIQF